MIIREQQNNIYGNEIVADKIQTIVEQQRNVSDKVDTEKLEVITGQKTN